MVRRAVAVVVAPALAGTALIGCVSSQRGVPAVIHVDDDADTRGRGTERRPFRSLQDALELAGPGTEVRVAAGSYLGPVITRRAGTAEAPIRLVRAAAEPAVLRGEPGDHLLTVRHSHVVVEGLTFEGADQSLVVEDATGVEVRGNVFRDAGGECVRLRRATDTVVADNEITGCGAAAFDLAADRKNGEGVYVGTSPDQTAGRGVDTSSGNRVTGNRITARAECVDIKEGATANLVEGNHCSGSEDPVGGLVSVRGNGNVVRANRLEAGAGAGIRLGGSEATDGTDNVIVSNSIERVDDVGVKVVRQPQRELCGNVVVDARRGNSNTRAIDPTVAC